MSVPSAAPHEIVETGYSAPGRAAGREICGHGSVVARLARALALAEAHSVRPHASKCSAWLLYLGPRHANEQESAHLECSRLHAIILLAFAEHDVYLQTNLAAAVAMMAVVEDPLANPEPSNQT